MTIQQANQQVLFQLFNLYDEREARNIADLVMERVTEWKRIDRILNKTVPLSPSKEQLLEQLLQQLSAGKPVQYVLHEAWFYGLPFYVDERVLIPRPETEELVKWAIDESRLLIQSFPANTRLQLMDIGTGSGCIPIAIKKTLPAVDVFAADISAGALAVAARNATLHETPVQFIESDFLDSESRQKLPASDIIISNPPYIPARELSSMALHVTRHEPHGALFVPDENPLLFYEALASFARSQKNGVTVLVEIHESSGNDVAQVFAGHHFSDIIVRRDMQGKERMVKATSKQNGN